MIANLLIEGGTFVDVGANTGLHTCTASKVKNVSCFAIEPFPKALTALIESPSVAEAAKKADCRKKLYFVIYGIRDLLKSFEIHAEQ